MAKRKLVLPKTPRAPKDESPTIADILLMTFIAVMLGGLAMLATVSLRKADCYEAEEFVFSMDYCGQWGSQSLCIIQPDDLVRYRRESEKLRGKFCESKGYRNPNDPTTKEGDGIIILELADHRAEI